MKSIKWTGPKHYPAFGVCEPGQVVTEEQVDHDVMQRWVDQGMAEWIVEPVFLITGPVKDVSKKKKIIREA
jgi:hypothetical protein